MCTHKCSEQYYSQQLKRGNDPNVHQLMSKQNLVHSHTTRWTSLANMTLKEKSNSQKTTHIVWFYLYELSRKSKSIETEWLMELKSLRAGRAAAMRWQLRRQVVFWSHQLYALNGWIIWYENYILIKLLWKIIKEEDCEGYKLNKISMSWQLSKLGSEDIGFTILFFLLLYVFEIFLWNFS